MTVSPEYMDFIRRLEDYRFSAENMKSTYEQQRNGISPERLYDPQKHKEDKDKLDEAIASHLRYIETHKNQKNKKYL